ncbi:MAG: acyl-CoA dehydrogenase family protein [Catalinimonas sp.]
MTFLTTAPRSVRDAACSTDARQRAGQLADRMAARLAEDPARSHFPEEEFNWLRAADLHTYVLPGAPPVPFHDLLLTLAQVGRGNLAVGRIWEGHVNAMQLMDEFGTDQQKRRWADEVRTEGRLSGVWNAEARDELRVVRTAPGRYRLEGCKTFCSGSKYVTRPIVPGRLIDEAGRAGGRQMTVIPLDRVRTEIDPTFWRPLGMASSVSHRIDFTGVELTDADLLGTPDDYHVQPRFSGGAIRFTAVQLGGAQALVDATRHFLRTLNRTDDPYQQHRLGEMAVLIEGGYNWLAGGARRWEAQHEQPAETLVQYANMMRTAVEHICLDVIRLTERCVGARGLLEPQPFGRLVRDLTHYLRQPNPDGALAAVGRHVGTQTAPAHELWD